MFFKLFALNIEVEILKNKSNKIEQKQIKEYKKIIENNILNKWKLICKKL